MIKPIYDDTVDVGPVGGLRELFEASSIAVVGASRSEGKIGHVVLRNIIDSGYRGALYPVNPKADSILGLRTFPDVSSILGEVEMAVITVPNHAVPQVMEDAGEKGVKVAVVITAGFKETGGRAQSWNNRWGDSHARHPVLGPNCLSGHIHRHETTFTNDYPRGLGGHHLSGAIWWCWTGPATRIGFSKFVSVGNKLDIDEADLMTYLKDDEGTKVIGMYIEGMARGQEFMRAARAVTREKPVIALKAGRTAFGAKATSSHTGALSGSDQVYEAALAQSGVMRVDTIDELFDLLQAFGTLSLPQGDGLAIVTNAGGLGVLAADAVSDHGISLASFTKETVERLASALPEEAGLYNPVDVIGDADSARFEHAINTVMEDPHVHMVLAMLAPTDMLDVTSVARTIASFSGTARVPVATAFVGGEDVAEGSRILMEAGVPSYQSPDRAVRALAAMVDYGEIPDRKAEHDATPVQRTRQ